MRDASAGYLTSITTTPPDQVQGAAMRFNRCIAITPAHVVAAFASPAPCEGLHESLTVPDNSTSDSVRSATVQSA